MTDDLNHLARLAGLRLSDDTASIVARDVKRILAHVDRLRTVDTAGVEPTFAVPPPAPFEPSSDAPPHREVSDRGPVVEPAALRTLFVERDGDALRALAPAAGETDA